MSKKGNSRLNLANAMTSFRLLGGGALAFIEPLSLPFYIVYALCGLSDGLDGTVARHFHTASEFGAKLDSIADLVFYTVLLVRILPAMVAATPGWIWYWVGGIVALRLAVYGVAAVKYRRFASRHTWLNKLTSFSLFLVPYMLSKLWFGTYGIIVCVIATLAAVEEMTMHLILDDCDTKRKSIWGIWKK